MIFLAASSRLLGRRSSRPPRASDHVPSSLTGSTTAGHGCPVDGIRYD